jgi:hypothetical protein
MIPQNTIETTRTDGLSLERFHCFFFLLLRTRDFLPFPRCVHYHPPHFSSTHSLYCVYFNTRKGSGISAFSLEHVEGTTEGRWHRRWRVTCRWPTEGTEGTTTKSTRRRGSGQVAWGWRRGKNGSGILRTVSFSSPDAFSFGCFGFCARLFDHLIAGRDFATSPLAATHSPVANGERDLESGWVCESREGEQTPFYNCLLPCTSSNSMRTWTSGSEISHTEKYP